VIPIGPILLAVAIAARRQQQNGDSNRDSPIGPLGLIVWIVGPIWLSLFFVGVRSGDLIGVVPFTITGFVLVAMFPWLTVTRLAVPLGLPRIAWTLSWLSDVLWRGDKRGGAATAAAWALLREKSPSEKTVAWVERRVERVQHLRGGTVLAAGILAARRGDLTQARRLVHSLELFGPRGCARVGRKLGTEWLVVDAVAEGRWSEVATVRSLVPTTAPTRFLVAVARRLTGAEVSRARLVWTWLRAGRWAQTLPLLRRAWAAAPSTVETAAPAPLVPTGDLLADALARHAAALAAAPSEAALVELGHAWERAFDDAALRRSAAERALALAAPSGEAALRALQESVLDDLVALLDARGGVAQPGGLLERAADRLRDRALTAIEELGETIRARAVAARPLSAIDEWREWLALHTLHTRGVERGGLPLRRLAFPSVHRDICKLAVWLWNTRKERSMAHAMFRWLHDEALAVEDTEAIELQAKNMDCGE
jgi:hypothetical protein